MNPAFPRSHFRLGALALAIAALTPSLPAFGAPGDKVGSEFRVNTFTPEGQGAPALARSANGDFVVTWADYSEENQGIYFRRYRANGAAKDLDAVRVATPLDNDFGPSRIATPDVAMDEDGDFVVVWRNISEPYDFSEVMARRYSAGGTPRDPSPVATRRVCSDVEQGPPSVAMDSSGDYVVAYGSYDSDANDNTFFVGAILFKADGSSAGCLNGSTHGRNPVVAMESDGDFVLAYDAYDYDDTNNRRTPLGIVARRYTAAGAPKDAANIFVTPGLLLSAVPEIAVNDLGEFIVSWELPNAFPGTTSSNIMMRRYNGDGTPKAGAAQVNAAGSGLHRDAEIGLANDGSFTVAWERLPTAQNNSEVFWRSFGANGAPVTAFHQQANTYATSFQDDPALAVNADGSFVVAWESQDQDGSGDGVYAQRFAGRPASLPTVRFTPASSSVAEIAGTVKLLVRVSRATTRDVTVPISLGGTASLRRDYRLPVASVLVPAGQTSARLRVVVIDDTRKEPNETVILNMGTPVNARLGTTPSHQLTILAND